MTAEANRASLPTGGRVARVRVHENSVRARIARMRVDPGPGRLRACLSMVAVLLAMLVASPVRADTGYDLWLRYQELPAAQLAAYRGRVTELVAASGSATQVAARDELLRGLGGLLGTRVPTASRVSRDGAVLIGTPASAPAVRGLALDLATLGRDGYTIKSTTVDGHATTVIAANTDVGALYGAFHFLQLLQTAQPLQHLDVRDRPRIELRILDHWDDLNGRVERGYAGASIWDWWTLPDYRSQRYVDYARANASLGINGAVLNNVNADPLILTHAYLVKVAALADVFRAYGIRVYLSVPFNAPMSLGHLATADPLDPTVRSWWRHKVDEIYQLIPDFGGFLVKADSEGQAGPLQYHRTEADGANMLAAALAPHHGVLMWRAFVYWNQPGADRIKQEYEEFHPLDGKFAANVLLQVKNGPLDFQPREPFNPLFGSMPHTNVMLELQITKEYLGNNTNLVYLGPLYQEVMDSDTMANGPGSTVAKVVDGRLDGRKLTGIAGVANIGADLDWCGSIFDQANWYVFGRLAWNPTQSARTIAAQWVRMTFGNDPAVVTSIVGMMMGSREAAVDYMTPLGLASLMQAGGHQGPEPWGDQGAADVTPVYFARADRNGIGFDRTATGSDAVAQYAPPVARRFAGLDTVPEKYLLWFHHVPWTYRLRDGHPLWYGLVADYTAGLDYVKQMRKTWASLDGRVDPERHAQVAAFLRIQQRDAQWWRDACLSYFQSLNGLPMPAGFAPPAHPLSYYNSLHRKYVPGNPPW